MADARRRRFQPVRGLSARPGSTGETAAKPLFLERRAWRDAKRNAF